MKHCTRILTGLILSTALFAGVSYGADEKGKSNKPAAKTDDELAFDLDAAWKRRIPELHVGDNLPLADVARIIGKEFPEMNFIVPENARDTSVPGIWLRNATLSDILKAIELASVGRIRTTGSEKAPAKVDAAGLPIAAAPMRQNMIGFLVSRPSPRDVQSPPPSCRVFNLVPYLEGRTAKESEPMIQELYDALNLAWEMMKKGGAAIQTPTLSIHSGTKLLIAVGRDQELNVIEQVVKQLRDQELNVMDHVVRQLQGSTGSATVSEAVQNEKSKSGARNQNQNPARP